jgi:hypothetical protein
MFYSTRYFFRLIGLLLAMYLAYTRFPVLLRGAKHIWEYIEYFFSHYALENTVSGRGFFFEVRILYRKSLIRSQVA